MALYWTPDYAQRGPKCTLFNKYLPHLARPAKVSIYALSYGDKAAYQTVELMRDFVYKATADPAIRELAVAIVSDCPPKDYDCELKTIFETIQNCIRYTRDPFLAEGVQSPQRTILLGGGDCDDMVQVLAALLSSVGFGPMRFVLAACDPKSPDVFSHVYLEVFHKGQWVALDPTEPYPPGWRPPCFRSKAIEI
jgi:transglutaminase-like putative cysteine protease